MKLNHIIPVWGPGTNISLAPVKSKHSEEDCSDVTQTDDRGRSWLVRSSSNHPEPLGQVCDSDPGRGDAISKQGGSPREIDPLCLYLVCLTQACSP